MISPISSPEPVSSIHFALLVLGPSSVSVAWSPMEATHIGIRVNDEALVSFHHPPVSIYILASLQTSAGSLHVPSPPSGGAVFPVLLTHPCSTLQLKSIPLLSS